MPRATWTISLPPAFAREAEEVRKREHRSRSELVREALRTYLRTYTPTASELRAIEKGRAEMRRGQYYTLNELDSLLARSRRSKRRPKARKA
jgi:Arc/MetJ-type ribon-helix-helix transcriptional regulator